MSRYGFLCVLLVVALSAGAEEWEQTYSVDSCEELRLESSNANIRVTGSNRSDIHAVVTTRGWRIADDEVRIIESQNGGRVSIEVRLPRVRWSWGRGVSRSVHIDVEAPRSCSVVARTGDGNIDLEEITGGTRVRTGDGKIIATRLEGVVEMDSGDGDIDAISLRGRMEINTGDGSISGDNLEGRLVARTGDGNVRVDGRFDLLDLRTGDGNIVSTAIDGSEVGEQWRLQTGDGNLVLHLPDGFAADLEARTGDGRVEVDHPVSVSGKIKKSQVRGKMNGGGGPLRLTSGDGNIRVRRI